MSIVLGKHYYSHQSSVVEPVFANIGTNKGLDRFTLRGKQKVQGQWRLYCLVRQHREADAVWGDNVSTIGYPQPWGRNAQCGDYVKGVGGILSRKTERGFVGGTRQF